MGLLSLRASSKARSRGRERTRSRRRRRRGGRVRSNMVSSLFVTRSALALGAEPPRCARAAGSGSGVSGWKRRDSIRRFRVCTRWPLPPRHPPRSSCSDVYVARRRRRALPNASRERERFTSSSAFEMVRGTAEKPCVVLTHLQCSVTLDTLYEYRYTLKFTLSVHSTLKVHSVLSVFIQH